MSDIIELQNNEAGVPAEMQNELRQVTDALLEDTEAEIAKRKTMSVPIGSLASLGTAVSSLAPALQTVINGEGGSGFYYVNTKGLQMFQKNGTNWFIGALKNQAGLVGGGQAQMAPVMFNPETMMMAVALYSIEQKLDKIEEMQQQIIDFLLCENESGIEADVQMLSGIISKYKFNWDNEHYVASNHNLVLDIKRKSLKNMRSYQKQVTAMLEKKQLFVAQNDVESALVDMQRKFKYYRMALYTYSLASLLEIMLEGNFKEEYISTVKTEIEGFAMDYRGFFEKASMRLEQLGNGAFDINLLKVLGEAGQAVGKIIGAVPGVRQDPVDEFLQEKGARLIDKASDLEKKAVYEFAALGNPGTSVLTERMSDMIQIYNHTECIYFDRERIYLVGESA